MEQQRCISCDASLSGRPRIELDGNVFCYACAKQRVDSEDCVVEKKYAAKLKDYEFYSSKHEKWKEQLKSALPSFDSQATIVAVVAIGMGLLWGGLLFFLGIFAGLVVNTIIVKQKRDKWVQKNPEPNVPPQPLKHLARSRIKQIGGIKGKSLTGSYRTKILKRDNYTCQICREIFPADELEVHHIRPQAKGGKHFSTNLVTLCYRCHIDENWFGHKHKMR